MLNGYIITSVFLALTFILLGLVVFLRSPKKRLNRTYLAFSVCMGVWLASNYLGSTDSVGVGVSLAANRTLFVFAGLAATFLLMFSFYLTKTKRNIWLRFFIPLGVASSLVSGTHLVVQSVYPDNATYAIIFGPLANLYFGLVIITLGWAIGHLVRTRHGMTMAEKAPIDLILLSVALASVGIIATNVILPLLSNNYSLTSSGSFFSALIVFAMAYSIIRHKLFDIRLIIARSLAYVLLVSSLVGIYVLAIFGLTNSLFDESTVIARQIMPIFAALFVAATAPYFKKFFDMQTNRFFYRDAYDPQAFLDQLNASLVSNIELGILLRHTSRVIDDNLKSQHSFIIIQQNSTEPFKSIGSSEGVLDSSDLSLLGKQLSTVHQKIAVVDDFGSSHARLKALLLSKSTAVVAKLILPNDGLGPVAYLILGSKRSGNTYSKQDLRIINIIADELVIAIQNSLRYEEIQRFAATLQSKVNDATAKLKQTNDKLKAMDEAKDEFISMASHQLRTPLTSVKGYLSMVLEGDVGEITPAQKKLLDQAFVSSQRMVYLIADLLNVSRLKTGKFIIDAHQTNLADLIQGEISQLTEQAKLKNLKIEYKKPENFPSLMFDETKTRQVVMNFIDNALYYTPSGGTIKVLLTEDKSNIYFMVKDNGLGVPKEEQKNLFTKFFRAKNARKARPDGTGLGLFMAKKVITAQGGNLLFESTEGKGSTFGFSFSKKPLIP